MKNIASEINPKMDKKVCSACYYSGWRLKMEPASQIKFKSEVLPLTYDRFK